MNKYFVDNRSCLYDQVIPFLERTNNLIEAEAYLTWNSSVNPQVKNLELSKELGKKSYIINHGIWGEEDHCDWIRDIHTGIYKRPMLADYYMCWGDQGKEALMRAGYKDSQLPIVGCPIVWDSAYEYFCEGYKPVITSYCGGKKTIDPATGKIWELSAEKHWVPEQLPDAKWILYIASHDTVDRHLIHTKKTWDLIKDVPDLIVKASDSYIGEHDIFKDYRYENICKECGELVRGEFIADGVRCKKCNGECERRIKIAYGGINKTENIIKMRRLIRECKCVVIDYASTPNVLCYTQGVPVIVIKNDYGMREGKGDLKKPENWETTYHTTDADILCKPENLVQTIKDVLSEKIDKKAEMKIQARRLADVQNGFPGKRILKLLGEE